MFIALPQLLLDLSSSQLHVLLIFCTFLFITHWTSLMLSIRVHDYGTIHGSMVDLPRATPQQKVHTLPHQPPTVACSSARRWSLWIFPFPICPFHARVLTGFILTRMQPSLTIAAPPCPFYPDGPNTSETVSQNTTCKHSVLSSRIPSQRYRSK